MTIELPNTIAAYFEADRHGSADEVAACFTPHAIVRDEGQMYAGREAIRQWKTDSSRKYTYTAEPIALASEGDRVVVTCHLVGNFPGSPTDLRYFFLVNGAKIADMEVIP